MLKPTVAFEAAHLFLPDPLPTRTDRINTRLWVVSVGATIIPLAFNEVSKMFHAMEEKESATDWFAQEGLIHHVRGFDASWYDPTTEIPLFVEFTKAQQDRAGQNVRGFLVANTNVIFIGGATTNMETAIPPLVHEYRNKAQMLLTMMRNDPSKDLSFAFKREENDEQVHMPPQQLTSLLNNAAALLGGYQFLVTTDAEGKDVLDWKNILTVTGTTL
jgi:hypothetical protein